MTSLDDGDANVADEELAQRMEVEPSQMSKQSADEEPLGEQTGGSMEPDTCDPDLAVTDTAVTSHDNCIGANGAIPKIEDDDDTDLEHFLEQAGENYTLCELHSSEMLEKNIVCLTCQMLMCALCFRDSHLSHEIVSVGKLKACRSIRNSMDNEINRLQLIHKSMTQQYRERKELKQKIETSMDSLLMKVDKAFEQLANIVLAKHKEIRNHIQNFSKLHIYKLKNEMTKLTEMESTSAEVIRKMLSIFTKSGYQQASELPTQLKSVLARCVTDFVSELEDQEKYIPESKFSKILPSLQAISNICQTIHPEATKVVWSKVTPDKRKHFSQGMESKKSRLSDSMSSQTPESSQQSLNSEDFIPDSSTALDKEKDGNSQSTSKEVFRLLKFDIRSLEPCSTCQCVLIESQNKEGSQLAKVCDISGLNEGLVGVKWLIGRIGCSKYFYLDKKKADEMINTKNVLCHFVFPFNTQELPSVLEQELMAVLKTKLPKSRRKSKSRKMTVSDIS